MLRIVPNRFSRVTIGLVITLALNRLHCKNNEPAGPSQNGENSGKTIAFSTFTQTISSSEFNRAGIPSGSTVYMVGYPSSNRTFYEDGIGYLDTGYLDQVTGNVVYPNIGQAGTSAVSVVIP